MGGRTKEEKLRLPVARTCLKGYQLISLLRAAALLNRFIDEDTDTPG